MPRKKYTLVEELDEMIVGMQMMKDFEKELSPELRSGFRWSLGIRILKQAKLVIGSKS